jgi:hypothetical protein
MLADNFARSPEINRFGVDAFLSGTEFAGNKAMTF